MCRFHIDLCAADLESSLSGSHHRLSMSTVCEAPRELCKRETATHSPPFELCGSEKSLCVAAPADRLAEFAMHFRHADNRFALSALCIPAENLCVLAPADLFSLSAHRS